MARPITGSGPSLPRAPLADHTFELSDSSSAAECAHEQAELDDELLELVLDAHRRDPREYGVVPFRPALLAYELRITRALPELARCLEPLPGLDPRARASVRALERRRAEALDELLQEFGATTKTRGPTSPACWRAPAPATNACSPRSRGRSKKIR